VFLRDVGQMAAALAANPFAQGADDPRSVHLFFLAAPAPDTDLVALKALATQGEAFHLGETVFYLHTPEGIGRSALAGKLQRYLKVPMTARNLRSVAALAELARQMPD